MHIQAHFCVSFLFCYRFSRPVFIKLLLVLLLPVFCSFIVVRLILLFFFSCFTYLLLVYKLLSFHIKPTIFSSFFCYCICPSSSVVHRFFFFLDIEKENLQVKNIINFANMLIVFRRILIEFIEIK